MIPTIRRASVALAILFASSPCLAQTDVENIRSRVKDGQKVSVTDDGGQVFDGRISAMTADGLRIQTSKMTADVRFDRIVRIDRPNDGDPQEWFDCSDPTAGGYVAAALVGAGLGTAIGVGVDALIHRQREIYHRAGVAHATVAPALGRGVRGAVVTLTW